MAEFERVLFDTLLTNLRKVVTRKRAMKAFLDDLQLDKKRDEPAAVRQIIEEFSEQERPVIMSYARSDTVFPVWSVVLANETEHFRVLGDDSGEEGEDGEDERVSVWESTYQVLVYSNHPDTTYYLYALLRRIILATRLEMIDRAGVEQMTGLSGAELSPDRIWMPEFLFVRAATTTVTIEHHGLPFLGKTEKAQPLRAKRVTGVHVAVQGAPPDGVRHGVRPYRR